METIALQLIVSAGMPRSGSTLLFNILRLILQSKYGTDFYSGLEPSQVTTLSAKSYLLKVHELTDFHLHFSDKMFYTFRDMRVAAVSNSKKFNVPITMELFDNWMIQFELAQSHGAYMIQFEDLIRDVPWYIEDIAFALGISIDGEFIYRQITEIQPPATGSYDPVTLLHPQHFTHTKDFEPFYAIDGSIRKQLISKYGHWFKQYGYPLSL
jgi:hypothetical protein